jgi:polysaccharide pyruvyl transferase WcaK-like protein
LGGGQLFADADLNFPLKIKTLASIVRERHLPSVVFGVGVSRTWSDAGASLFRKAMDAWAPRFVAARDQESVANWNAHFANTNQVSAQLCRDPGLLAALVYAEAGHQSRGRPVIGVGVVHPLTLNLHTHESNLSLSQATELWKLLVIALCKRDMDVALFTNGPADDESFLELIFEALPSDERRRVTRLPRPRLPADLVRNIASCDAIAAHRLHANIVAFACKVGHVGLGWDAKLPAFFKSVGREDFFAGDIQSVAADTIAEKIVLALKMPVPAQVYDTVIEETWSGIEACAAVLSPDKAG